MAVKSIFLCIFLVFSAQVVCCEVKFGVGHSPPYAYKTESGVWSGSDVETIQFLVKNIDCELLFIEGSFSERLKMLKLGLIDVMSNISKLNKRNSFLTYIGPLRLEKLSLVTTINVSETITNFASISQLDYHFGKPANAYLGELFTRKFISDQSFSSKFIDIHSNNDIYELIRKGRIVGFFDESNSLSYRLKMLSELTQLKRHPLEIVTGNIFFGISKKTMNAEKISQLELAFIKFSKSKTIKKYK